MLAKTPRLLTVLHGQTSIRHLRRRHPEHGQARPVANLTGLWCEAGKEFVKDRLLMHGAHPG
jgi:hypothetical protein